MVQRTAVGRLALWALVCSCAQLAMSGAQAETTLKRDFLCRIELPPDFTEHVDTNDSVKVCADSYISITCRADLGAGQTPPSPVQGVDCVIQGAPCGVEGDALQATQSTFKIDADGKARLSCLYRRP